MVKYLFFDTETNGLSKNWYASKNQVDAWPRIVQIAWVACDDVGTILSKYKSIIKPDGWDIEQGAIDIHGITYEYAESNGIPIEPILYKFANAINECDLIIAHNFIFDDNVVGAEFVRANIKNSLNKKKHFCTMISTKKLCKVVGNYGKYKYPKLTELYFKLFNIELIDSHDALIDVRACARCFYELKRIGVIKI